MDYFVLNGEECLGPFSLDQLRLHVTPNSLIKRDGEQNWQRQQNFPELQACNGPSPGIGSQPAHLTRLDAAPKPWDPRTIALAGLLFTPIWSAVMAALNEQRLKTGNSYASSLWIAAIWLVADFVVFPWLGWGLLATWVTTTVCLWLLWEISLVEQLKFFNRFPIDQNADHYGLPMLAGLPALVMLCVQAYNAATTPLSPYEVCQRFQKASVADQADYASPKMRELLADIERFPRAGGTMNWELSQDPKDVYSLNPEITLVAITVTIIKDKKVGPSTFPAFLQLVSNPKQGFLVDDLVVSVLGQMTLSSFHEHRGTMFNYRPQPPSIAKIPLQQPPNHSLSKPPNSNKSQLQPYVIPAALAAKAMFPAIVKFLAVVGIGALALGKGFFSTAPKRREST